VSGEAPIAQRTHYRAFLAIPTRWMDNDAYGHVNNVVYYSYFDTAVNEHLIRAGGLDIERDPVVGYVVETSCRFVKPLAFPEVVDAGLRVVRIGNASVEYDIGLFRRATRMPPRAVASSTCGSSGRRSGRCACRRRSARRSRRSWTRRSRPRATPSALARFPRGSVVHRRRECGEHAVGKRFGAVPAMQHDRDAAGVDAVVLVTRRS